MIESAFTTALFAVLVVIFFCLLMCVATLVLSLIGLLIGFIWHLGENIKARRRIKVIKGGNRQ